MKLSPTQVAAALQDSARYVGLLIYGEDWGMVRERAVAAVRGVAGPASSPFQLATLTREEHGRLRTEAGSLSLGGGRRVIHVQDASDAIVAILDKMTLDASDTLIVLEAGGLPAKSKLRGLAEKHAAWGSIACHLASATQVADDVRTVLARFDLTASPDALAFLCHELAGESATRRSELEKLGVYGCGAGEVDLDMARSCCSVSPEASLGSAVATALAGQPDECDRLLAELTRDGATGPGLLAVLASQVQRLLKVRLLIDDGQDAEGACRALLPPLYPRQAAAFLRDVRRWRTPALEALGRAIREADIACKRAASPDTTIAARLLASVAARAGGSGGSAT